MNQSLSINLQPASAESARAERWVRLEQVGHPDVEQWANLFDVDQMQARARSGLSAWSYVKDSCPLTINSDGTVDVALDFWSFPSAFDFSYQVFASIGTVGERIRVELEREFDVVFDRTRRVELPYSVTLPSVEWVSPVIDRYGREMARPHITCEDAALTVPEEIGFGACRLRCIAHGYLHTVVIRLVKQTSEQDEQGNLNVTGFKISNLQCDATAAWVPVDGGHGEDKISLKIPKCVEDYLATCPDGDVKGRVGKKEDGEKPYVYYNDCTGSVLLVIYR